jgi:TP901 family phage tail tape measure protein
MTVRTVSVKLLAEVSGYLRGLKTANVATRDFVSELDKAAKAGRLDAVADQATKAGLGLTGLAIGAVTMAARFEKAMSSVQSATHASGAEMEMLREAALQAGKDTAFSATEAAGAIEELSKAGVSTADILGGGLSGALSLAAAGQIDVSEAAETAASTLTQFGLKGRDVSHVADLLAAAAGKAQGGVHEMSFALQQSGLVASQMGLSVEETTGTLAAFASAGLLGSDAGTSFKTMLQRLVAPTDEVKGLMDELGISAFDAQGKFVGMARFAGTLHDALANMTDQQRNATLATIFGSDAIRAAAIVYQQGEEGVQGWIGKVDDTGYAAETAALKTNNLAGDIERLTGELETLAIQSGSGANSGLRTLVQGLENIVSSVSNIPGPVQNAAVVIAGVGGAALLASAGTIRLKKSTAEAMAELRKTGPIGAKAADGLERTGKAARRLAITMAALQVAGATMGSSVNPQIELLTENLAEFGENGELSSEAARVFGKDLSNLDAALNDIANEDAWHSFVRGTTGLVEGLTGAGNLYNQSLQHSRERLEALDQALTNLVQSGRADDAAAAFQQIAERAKKQGVSLEELRKVLPGYAAAVEMAGSASAEAADGVDKVGTAADKAADQAEQLKEAFDALFESTMNADRASIAYLQQVKDTNAELTKGKRTLDIYTQAGQENRTAILDEIDANKAQRDAIIRTGGSIEVANRLYEQNIDKLRAHLKHLGFDKAAVEELIKKYREIPVHVVTDVKADTAGANAALTGFVKRINTIDGRVITVRTRITSAGEYIPGQGTSVRNRWGGLYEHAQSGLLREAAIYSPDTPARYAFAEPATGGEAFIPMRGDIERSRAIWEHIGRNWLGMLPRGGDGAGAAAPVYNNTQSINLYGSEATVERLSAWQREQAIRERVGRPR